MESGTSDFMVDLLRLMGYETETTLLRTRLSIPFKICEEYRCAKPDVALLDISRGGIVQLVIHEDKSPVEAKLHVDPEPQLVASAIAASRWQGTRFYQGKPPSETRMIPGICLKGTIPTFYKVKLAKGLGKDLFWGEYLEGKTVVYRHTPRLPDTSWEVRTGMSNMKLRGLIWRYFQAFKRFVVI